MRVRIVIIVAALGMFVSSATAAVKKHSGYPMFWRRQASCVRYKESRYRLHVVNSIGAAGTYQFLPSTWRFHVRHPFPLRNWPKHAENATLAQQTFIAWRTYVWDSRSWREWNYECG